MADAICYSRAMSPSPPDAAHRSRGLMLVVAATACFATLDSGTKYISATVPLAMAIWVRYVCQLLFSGLVLLPRSGGGPFATKHPRLQVARALMLVVSSSIAFLSLKLIPVGEFTAIVMISPLVITLVSAVALKERVTWVNWLLVSGGFVGALIVIRPGGDAFSWAMLLPLMLVLTNTGFQIVTSYVSRDDAAGTTHFIAGCVGAFVTTLALPFFWAELPSLWWWGALMVLGGLSTVGHYFLILGLSSAPASSLTPYLYAQIPFATLGGWLAFSHRPDNWTLIGIAVIMACGAAGPRFAPARR